MILVHTDSDGPGRLAELARDKGAAALSINLDDAACPDEEAIASWIADNQDAAMVLVSNAAGKADAKEAFFEALRRLVKINGLDVHIAGDEGLDGIADAVIRQPEDLEKLNARFATGKRIAELTASERMSEFERAEMDIPTVDEMMRSKAMSKPEAEAHIAWMKSQAVWVNNLYQVNIEFMPGSRAHITIRRLDKQPVHNWQHFQEIKNRFLGPECEAVEVYPRESHLVDAKHHYHLWGYSTPKETFGIGFTEREVAADRKN